MKKALSGVIVYRYTSGSPWQDTIYDSLLNPFGETLHVETHSVFEEVLGIFSAFMAVAVSAGRSARNGMEHTARPRTIPEQSLATTTGRRTYRLKLKTVCHLFATIFFWRCYFPGFIAGVSAEDALSSSAVWTRIEFSVLAPMNEAIGSGTSCRSVSGRSQDNYQLHNHGDTGRKPSAPPDTCARLCLA